MRYTDAELGVIKSTFAENDSLIFAIRKIFLQAPLNLEEQNLITKVVQGDVLNVLRKTFLPEVDPDAPLFQLIEPCNLLAIDLKDKTPESYPTIVLSRNIWLRYMRQQFAVLEGKESIAEIELKKLGDFSGNIVAEDAGDVVVEVIAKNYILSYIDTHLNQLVILSGLKTETVEETIERLKKNSTK